ncbi:MAG TPA: hypothetical protein VGI87_07155 [Solirubrobacteraceae bacterium]
MLELLKGVSRPELVKIVNDEHDGFVLLGDRRQHTVNHLIAIECSGRRTLRRMIDRTRRAMDRVQDDGPEALRIVLVAIHRHERDATKADRSVSPGTQQRGLPTSRRRRDDRHPFAHSAIQQPADVFPIEQAPRDQSVP